MSYIAKKLNEGIFHITGTKKQQAAESLLSRYHILHDPETSDETILFKSTSAVTADDTITLKYNEQTMHISINEHDKGYTLCIPVAKDVRMFGLGDVDRNSIERRGHKFTLWNKNVTSYGPIPFLVTTAQWGIFVNSTYKTTFDIDSDNQGFITIQSFGGTPDFYIFLAPDMKTIIQLYTDISGKPILLPKSAYGFTFICNEEEGAKDLLNNCANFRRENIPCDYLGLEPGWMETNYDFTTKKKWHPTRFYLPEWHPEDYNGEWSFFFNLRQMGCKLSLWICCDYDLLWEEEKNSLDAKSYGFGDDGEASIRDEHLGYDTMMDKLTVPGEPWFDHLRKFVRQGAAAFKCDGANHVLEHPDRLWAGTYRDDEVHNVYPVILAKQMKEGYEDETKGKRALINIPGVYAGTQQYAASWAGDTGCTPKTLISVLNHAMCGHSNTTCDVGLFDIERMHYGFLISWTQVNGWRNWQHPWLLGETLSKAVQYYSQLRSSLFPYLYSFAHKAARTGLAVVRPLSLVYEDTDKYDSINNLHMLGDFLLVGSFDMNLSLPEGIWTDYFDGQSYEGDISYQPLEGKGGALFVKDGAIIVTQEPMLYLEEKLPESYKIALYPGAACEFELVEDDGNTYEYLNGAYCTTKMSLSALQENTFTFTLEKRTGSFEDMPEPTAFYVTAHTKVKPKQILLENTAIDFNYDDDSKTVSFEISREDHCQTSLVYTVCLA